MIWIPKRFKRLSERDVTRLLIKFLQVSKMEKAQER